MNLILFILIVCVLVLGAKHVVWSQGKGVDASTRDMAEQIKQEILRIEARIAEDPSSPEVAKLKAGLQWNRRQLERISPKAIEQLDKEVRIPQKNVLKLEDYMIIVKNNLFKPLGSSVEVKRQEYALAGVLGRMAIIKTVDGSSSYYITEGDIFGDGARLIRIRQSSVTINSNGATTDLDLGQNLPAGPQRKAPVKIKPSRTDNQKQQQKPVSKEIKEQEKVNKEREQLEKKLDNLHRKREELKRDIAEKEEQGRSDRDAYRQIDEIDSAIRELESRL